MDIVLDPIGWIIVGVLVALALPLLAFIISKNPFMRWIGAVGLFMLVVILWGVVLGYHDAQYWGDQDRGAYMLTMTMIGVLIILTAVATLALAEIHMKHGWIIIWWVAGMVFAIFTVWTLTWILCNDWGSRFIRGKENATVEVWWGHEIAVSSTVAGMIAMILVGVLVLAYALASTKYRGSVLRSFRKVA